MLLGAVGVGICPLVVVLEEFLVEGSNGSFL